MVSELWGALLDYLKRTPYWPVLEPLLLVGFLYVGICIVSYQYLQWRYQVTLDLPLFLQSYLLRQVSVGFAAVLGVFIALTSGRAVRAQAQSPGAGAPPAVQKTLRLGRRRRLESGWLARIGLVLVISAMALYLLQVWTPEFKVSPIRVRFAAFGAFAAAAPRAEQNRGREKAMADYQHLREITQYLLYEINHRQRAWQLQFETPVFRTDLVTRADEDRCADNDTPPLCIAEAFHTSIVKAQGPQPPLVLIIAEPLGGGSTRAWFWLNRGPVSVVTTSDWGGPGSPGSIDYLAYALVVQSVMIHMQTYCGLTQPPEGAPEGVVVGNVFDLQPGIDAMRAAVLTGHFSREDERRLLNCFGPEYMRTAVSLSSLGWLRSGPVRDTLRKVYGVELLGS
ncbi:MAG TPA: hypothetical protein VFZ82_10190 [Methylomirabilota bacterium]|nr:hypothetical protein [Methylomirabilota bacterium]